MSGAALTVAARTLGALDGIRVHRHEMSYEAGLLDFAEARRSYRLDAGTVSRVEHRQLRSAGSGGVPRGIRAALRPGDALLIGADLVKPERELLLAYDDPLGVTAAFNLNVLCHINSRLDGDFEVSRFKHRAVWNAAESRVEMHLVSLAHQRVRLAAANVDMVLEEGETIWTESSYKFERRDMVRRLQEAGFETVNQWVDEGDLFALTLARAV